MISKKDLQKADKILAKEPFDYTVRCRISNTLREKLDSKATKAGYRHLSTYVRSVLVCSLDEPL